MSDVIVHPCGTDLGKQLNEMWRTCTAEKKAIIADMMWKVVRQDWHGVSDAANDLRELGL